MKLLGFATTLALCFASPALAAVSAIGTFRFPVSVSGHTLQIPYDGNQSLTDSHTQVVRAVVIIPGSARSSSDGYTTVRRSAIIAGLNDATSLLVVPQFLIEEDIAAFALPADHLYWSDSGWKQGDASLSTSSHPRPATISSFAVLDSILSRICSRNPNLQSIVVAGHSAGGQFVNRFAAGSAMPQALMSQYGIQLSFVVANPSSYLYLNAERVLSGTDDSFAVPAGGSCSSYDRYKYGLQQRNGYMAQVSSSQIVSQYRLRRVTYLLGELDNDPMALDLDTSCPAMMQGANRLERGRIFGNFLVHFYGAGITGTHSTVVVPGVGHDSYDMFTSPCGVSRLFQTGGCQSVAVESEGSASGQPRGGPVWCEPNPFEERTTIHYRLPGSEPPTVGIYDVRGRLLRRLEGVSAGRGTASVVWDGRTSSGERLPPGVYFVRLRNGRTISRVTQLR